jgi:hypothetical protein
MTNSRLIEVILLLYTIRVWLQSSPKGAAKLLLTSYTEFAAYGWIVRSGQEHSNLFQGLT